MGGTARRLSRFGLGVNERRAERAAVLFGAAAAMAVALFAAPARAVDLGVGLDAGYAFRSQADDRNHGAAADLFLDVPLPLWPRSPLGLRAEVLTLGFAGSDTAPATLGLFAGALSLVYAFDDTDVLALAAVGPLAAAAADAGPLEIHAGVLASIGVRFPVAEAASVEARVLAPALLSGPRGLTPPGQPVHEDGTLVAFPLQAAVTFGITIDLEDAFALAGGGDAEASAEKVGEWGSAAGLVPPLP